LYLRTPYILFFTGPDRAANATDRKPDRLAVDRGDGGEDGPQPFDLAAADPDDRLAVAVLERKVQYAAVQFGTAGVADEVLCGEPQLALERPTADVRVGPRLQPDREIPPPGPEVLRQMLHVRVLAVRYIASAVTDRLPSLPIPPFGPGIPRPYSRNHIYTAALSRGMPAERRDVLRLGSACLGAALAGCLGTDGADLDRGGSDPTPTPTPATDDTDDENGGGADSDDDPEPLEGPTRLLAEATRRVLDEASWFGREYDDAMSAYTGALDRAIETILQLESTTAITESDLERLGDVTLHVERTIEDRLEPHFELSERVRRRNDRATERVRRFGERGDRPAVNDELESLRNFYERIRGFFFRQRELSKSPIQNRLVPFMAAGGADRDDEDDAIHDTLFEFRYLNPIRYVDDPRYGIRYLRGVRFRARAHTEEAVEDRNDPRLLGDPAASPAGSTRWEPTDTFAERFEPVSVPEGRRDELEVVVNDWADYDGGPLGIYTEEFVSWPIYVQRYERFEAAAAARASLLDGPVFLEAERTVTIGDSEWQQVRYRLGGDVIYALFKQFGEFVVVAAPSRTPVEDRTTPSRAPKTNLQRDEAVVIRDDDDSDDNDNDDNDDNDDDNDVDFSSFDGNDDGDGSDDDGNDDGDGEVAITIPIGDVEAGDVIRVRPGERIPVDGVVTDGESTVDESALAGGSASVDKSPGDDVYRSTINEDDVLRIEAADYVDESWTLPLDRSWLHVEGE
jgi:hypothetical protein